MECEIYLRPLQIRDAEISFKWRNDPCIWKYTGSVPDRLITLEIELEWINKVLLRENEKRYAICLLETNQYIGNVQLTSIENDSAEFHIFIGDTNFWNMKIGRKASKLIIDIGFNEFNLSEIYLHVSKNNKAAFKSYVQCGFVVASENDLNYKMVFKK